MAEDIKLVIGTDNPTVVVTTTDKVDIKNAAKSSDINFVATGSSGIKGDTGPQGPAGTGITTEQAAAIDVNTAKNSFDSASINKLNNIEANAQVNRALLDEDNMASDSDTLAPTQQSVKAYVDGQTHLQIGTNSTNALAGNTTTISTSQASAITANTAKTGITTSQANAITANTSKTTNATHTGDVTGSVALTIGDGKVVTDKILDANVTTAKIADDSITEDKLANTLLAEIDANTAKETNVVQTTVTGNAGTATILETARAINGVDFNGSAPITITAAGSTLSDTVPVSKGGTGATSFADKAVIITQDSGTDTLAAVAMSTNGQLLIGGTDGPAVATLTQGNGITITNANGGITLAFDNDVDISGESGTVDNIGSLTGDVTSSNRATTIANDAVTYAKMQNVSATNVVLGRDSAGAGVVEEISAANLRTIINVEDGADVTDTANVTSSGALMDSEVTNLAQVKSFSSADYATAAQGTKADTAQQPPSEGAFANGDKTKLDSIAANATADQTNVTGSSGSCTGNAATATALTAGDKTIDGSLDIGSNTAGHDFAVYGATTNFCKMQWDASQDHLHFSDQAKIVFGTGGGPGGSDSSIQADGSNLVITNSAGNIQIGDTVEITGDLDVTGSVLPGITYIKILHSDFIADDVGRPAQIDDTGSDRWLKSHSTAKLYASVEIPLGFKATHVDVYGSGTSAVTVYEADIDSKTVTSKGTGNIGTQIDITDVTADATNYILIELAQASGEEVYGGKVTIAKV